MSALDVASRFYDAAIGEDTWDNAISGTAEMLGGATILLASGDRRDPASFTVWEKDFEESRYAGTGITLQDGLDPEINPILKVHYYSPAVICKAIDHRTRFHESVYAQSRIWREVMLPLKLAQPRVFTLEIDGFRVSGGFACVPGGRIDADAAASLELVLSHAAQALRLRSRIGARSLPDASPSELLNRVGVGVVLMDAEARILGCNAEAERVLDEADGISRSGGRLRLFDPRQDHRLRIGISLLGSGFLRAEKAEILATRRPSGLPGYSVSLFPAQGWGAVPGSGRACACLCISDPLAPGNLPDARKLRKALCLTQAEAEVARLAPLALSRQQLAGQLGVSENTVKTHQASIRDKLGLRNTAELAQVVARIAFHTAADT